MRKKSEEKKQKIIAFVNDFYRKTQRKPSLREIEAGTGISKTMVYRYLMEMNVEGRLRYDGVHGVETAMTRKCHGGTVSVPVVGQIACGQPGFAEEHVEEYLELPVSLLGDGDFFLLRAAGESMVGVGVEDGDLVLIRIQSTAFAGQIVVALVGNEATLKRYYPEPERKRIRLHPENETMTDIFVTQCAIQGVASKVIKELR